MDKRQAEDLSYANEIQLNDQETNQNPPKQNIEIFELDRNNSFTMQFDGDGSGIFHDDLFTETQGPISQRTRSTSTCLSTPRSLEADPTF